MNPEDQARKPEFTPRSLQGWIAKLNRQFPPALKTDWRQMVTDDFELHPWQRKSLTAAPTNRWKMFKSSSCKPLEIWNKAGELTAKL